GSQVEVGLDGLGVAGDGEGDRGVPGGCDVGAVAVDGDGEVVADAHLRGEGDGRGGVGGEGERDDAVDGAEGAGQRGVDRQRGDGGPGGGRRRCVGGPVVLVGDLPGHGDRGEAVDLRGAGEVEAGLDEGEVGVGEGDRAEGDGAEVGGDGPGD